MECIKSTSRSALVSFAPDLPYMAAGTMSGAVDLSFSSSANLEIFELDFTSDDRELPIVGSCPSNDRFNRLSWSKPIGDFGLGLVAGGLGDGTIGVWNPDKLIGGSEDQTDSFVAKLEKHTGPVRGLEFNSQTPHLLLSGADEGELCVWNLENPLEPQLYPSLKSTGSGAQTEVSFVSWNPKFQHILASTSYNGISVVWDLRQQKPVTSFSDSTKRRGSVLQWNPDISTHLVVASDDDSSPSLRVWDVRKTISPIREFVGHTKGVIAMSWCPHDSAFLLTCGKDNRSICWDTISGEIVSELPASTNGNFDVHWYPKIPGVISASSFDQKIGIYNIQACNRYATGSAMENEFTQGVHMRAPKWLKRPTGASFGFGGKLLSFQTNQSTTPNAPSGTSEVYVHNLVTEESLVNRSTEFEAAIQDGETSSLLSFCEKKFQDSLSEDEKETWGFLKVMFEEDGTARTKLVTYLGFNVPNEENENENDEAGNKLNSTLRFDEKVSKGELFPGEGNEFLVDNGEDFFNNPQPLHNSIVTEADELPNDDQIKQEQEVHIESAIDPTFDVTIQRALVVGDYKRAVLECINANRMADALVIAHVGGSSLWEITRDQYLKNSLSSYLKVVSALVTNDMTTLVNTRPLDSWKETLAMLCTFAQKDEWSALCDILASRLARIGNTLAATLCYMCAGNIDKTVEIWSHSLKFDQDGKSFVDLLQDLMEKTRVLAFATGQKRFSTSLSKLVEKYAELLSSQGLLTTAMEYLKLLESDDTSHDLAILRDRLAFSVAEKEPTQTSSYGAISQTSPYDQGLQQANSIYATDRSNFAADTNSQSYYQPQANIQGGQYVDNYQQPIASNYGYQQPQQTAEQKPLYSSPTQFQPAQPAQFQPTQPTQFQPAQPTQFQPAQHAQFQPTRPTQFNPAQSTQFQSTQPTFMPAHPQQVQASQFGSISIDQIIINEDEHVSYQWKSDDGSLSCGVSTFKGGRASMEDRFDIKSSEISTKAVYFFGIFDGHGGSRAAEYLKHHLFGNLMKHPNLLTDTDSAIRETYKQTDADFLEAERSSQRDDGSTASTAILIGNNLYIANVGDSRAVISRSGKAVQLSEDHKPNRTDERKRIESAGGFIMWAGTWRVGGVLAMSRAFGDRLLKQFVVADPDIQVETVDEGLDFLVLASDGLWDIVPNEEAVKIVTSVEEPEAAARLLTETAFSRGSDDNITCIVVKFNHKETPVDSDSTPMEIDSDSTPMENHDSQPITSEEGSSSNASVDSESVLGTSDDCNVQPPPHTDAIIISDNVDDLPSMPQDGYALEGR